LTASLIRSRLARNRVIACWRPWRGLVRDGKR
jgi:hypothetical protein